jgi:uncharacterized membrane protein YgdD (TMEM256/DUF423 family)
MSRIWLLAGAIAMFLGVAAGAFGAHGLKARLPAERLAIFETAARYQMIHALALLLLAALARQLAGPGVHVAGWAFLSGIVVFSGSLYLLALTGITRFGAITPVGGALFLLGWAALAWSALTAPHGPPTP